MTPSTLLKGDSPVDPVPGGGVIVVVVAIVVVVTVVVVVIPAN